MALTVKSAVKEVKNAVTNVPIPEELAKFLAEAVPEVLKDADHRELILEESDTSPAALKEFKILYGYVRPWGARQDPAIDLRKNPPKAGEPANIVRFTVKMAEAVKAPAGRPAGSRNGQ